MAKTPDIKFDVASVLNRGCRDYQEDAIATDFPQGSDFGYAVLSDGMGGHAAGDVASKIVVTEVFSELKFQSSDGERFARDVSDILKGAAVSANACMAAHTSNNPDTAGMGATLVAPVIVRDQLFWISIGDSPLYLFRRGDLRQLNEDHSLGPHIDYMVRSGMMSEDVGRNHPDRNALTSVLVGEGIERIDCPEKPFRLRNGDILVVASDGLQFLTNRQIRMVLAQHSDEDSKTIADKLLAELSELGDPEQDNVCFSVIKIDLQEGADENSNVFAHDFDGQPRRKRQVTTRPIKPRPVSPDEAAAFPPAAHAKVESEDDTSKADRPREGGPMFLRRRWLATDGGGA